MVFSVIVQYVTSTPFAKLCVLFSLTTPITTWQTVNLITDREFYGFIFRELGRLSLEYVPLGILEWVNKNGRTNCVVIVVQSDILQLSCLVQSVSNHNLGCGLLPSAAAAVAYDHQTVCVAEY